jgi:uncharacterized protein (TIGR03083 family)
MLVYRAGAGDDAVVSSAAIPPLEVEPFDPRRGARLLHAEAAAVLPILRALPEPAFDIPTLLPGWSVRDVLAHCSAALQMAAARRFHDFSPASNQQDVVDRRGWSVPRLLDELTRGYQAGAVAIAAAAGRLDGLALGEWVHGGDVRDALGLPGAYASDGLSDALVLLAERSRDRNLPATVVTLAPAGRTVRLGPLETEPVATLDTDPATLIRLCAARSPDPAGFALRGASAGEYLIFS